MQLLGPELGVYRDELQVDVLDTLERLRSCDDEWTRLCTHPEAHPATFDAVCRANTDLVRPHVVVVRRGGRAVAMAVARIQDEAVTIRFGLASPLAPKLRVLRLAYKGIAGDESVETRDCLMKALTVPLDTGEADAIYFDQPSETSPEFVWARAPASELRRDLAPVRRSDHWAAYLPGSFEEFVDGLSKNERRNFISNRNKVQKHFGDRCRVACYRSAEDFETMARDTASIAVLTYQKALGVSYVDQFWSRPLLSSALAAGLGRCYILYIDAKPVAFYHGLSWRGTFHGSLTGYDPDYAEFGVGRLLVQRIIEDLCNDPEMDRFDFGFGHAPYKSRLGNEHWIEASRYVFARSFRSGTVNGIRGAVEGAARLSDVSIAKLGLRDAVKAVWWRRATKQS